MADRPTLPRELVPKDWEAIEAAFRGWYAENLHALEMGGVGDLVALVAALKAASPNL
jgi:hypothetical protein